MARTDFNTCPECGIGKMKPTGGAATSMDPNTSQLTGDYREYKCDHCGHPKEDGKAKVVIVNEQVNVGEPPNTVTATNTPAAAAAAQDAAAEAVEAAAEEENR
jgi:hypothetical protein